MPTPTLGYTCTMLVYLKDKLLAEESTSLPLDKSTLAETARLAMRALDADHVVFVGDGKCYYDSNDTGTRH